MSKVFYSLPPIYERVFYSLFSVVKRTFQSVLWKKKKKKRKNVGGAKSRMRLRCIGCKSVYSNMWCEREGEREKE